MKIPKLSELIILPELQLQEKLAEMKKELLKVNAKIATKVIPDNPGSIKLMKKTVAKILTIMKSNKNKKSQ